MLSRNTLSLYSNMTASSISSEDKKSIFKQSMTILPNINKEKLKNKSFTIDSDYFQKKFFSSLKHHSIIDPRETEIKYQLQEKKFKILGEKEHKSFKNFIQASPSNSLILSKFRPSNSISVLKETFNLNMNHSNYFSNIAKTNFAQKNKVILNFKKNILSEKVFKKNILDDKSPQTINCESLSSLIKNEEDSNDIHENKSPPSKISKFIALSEINLNSQIEKCQKDCNNFSFNETLEKEDNSIGDEDKDISSKQYSKEEKIDMNFKNHFGDIEKKLQDYLKTIEMNRGRDKNLTYNNNMYLAYKSFCEEIGVSFPESQHLMIRILKDFDNIMNNLNSELKNHTEKEKNLKLKISRYSSLNKKYLESKKNIEEKDQEIKKMKITIIELEKKVQKYYCHKSYDGNKLQNKNSNDNKDTNYIPTKLDEIYFLDKVQMNTNPKNSFVVPRLDLSFNLNRCNSQNKIIFEKKTKQKDEDLSKMKFSDINFYRTNVVKNIKMNLNQKNNINKENLLKQQKVKLSCTIPEDTKK